MASWPSAERQGVRARTSPAVRRRVEHALRQEIRRAMVIAAPLVAIGVGADAIHLALRFGTSAAPAVVLEGAVIGMTGLLALLGRAMHRRPELAALGILVLIYAVTLTTVRLLPAAATSSVAYLAVILAGSALFLAWTPRWHAVWLGVAAALTVAYLLAAMGAPTPQPAATEVAMAAAVAGAASLVGHRLVYARTRGMLEQQVGMITLTRHARRQERAVEELNRELLRTARLDTVTGIGNRRALDEALAALIDRRLAVVILDIDHFKAFNDRNGHLAGDNALARVGKILRSTVRAGDHVFRYGGEEFLILLPDADREHAGRLAERVRETIEAETAGDLGLTVSAGVAVADRFSASSPLPLLRRADAALYRAKRTGRNRVVVDELDSPSPAALAG